MNISILGSGWLALPLAQDLTHKDHKVIVTSTTAKKAEILKAKGFNTLVYRIGEAFPAELLTADVIIIANTCKDISAYQNMIDNWPDLFKPQVIYTSSTAVYLENGQTQEENSQALYTEHPTYLIEQTLKEVKANFKGKSFSGKEIRVINIVGIGDANASQMVYFPKSNKSKILSMFESADKSNTLFVSEDDLVEFGIPVSFILTGSKLGFKVSKKNLNASGLKISSSLLSLAQIVD